MAERKPAGDPGRFLARPISLASYPVATGRPLPGPRARVRVIEEVNAGGINAGHQPAVAIVRPAAAAPPRDPGRFLARPISLASYPVATGRPLPGPRARVRVIEEVNAGRPSGRATDQGSDARQR